MSSYDKIVKLACKPKNAAPKAKYIDPIIAATWSDEGSISDVCKALAPRIREPNHVVVFKALIVLHTMIRNGSTDNVLSYLSQADILRLKNVSAATWEGYSAPENLQHYATYLDSRIRAYGQLKHDAIRVQSDTNRDIRNSVVVDQDTFKPPKKSTPSAPQLNRSKTLAGRKLRSMTVEKGLLRETKIVHHMIDALVECRFYLDDLEDELNINALRMLVKDLLILFQAGNEGVINVLEHYFEMSHIDATAALKIYRNFCSQTEKVVEYLGVARKLQNLLNVPIPNLKHAPVSLAGALQEYLDDPNFEDNRQEYKLNKQAADKPSTSSVNGNKKSPPMKKAASTPPMPSVSVSSPAASGSTSTNGTSLDDFFNSIEEKPMFSPQSSPQALPAPQIQLQPTGMAPNPFAQFAGAPQMTMQAQPTGFIVPQQTATPGNPFNSFLSAQPTGAPMARPFSAFIPQQQTGFLQPSGPFMQPQTTGPGFLQPQATGSNPFRQSMLFPQSTGAPTMGMGGPFGNANIQPQPTGAMGQNLFMQSPPQQAQASSAPNSASPFAMNLFGQQQQQLPQQQQQQHQQGQQQQQQSMSAFGGVPFTPSFNNPMPTGQAKRDVPARPASTPLTSISNQLSSSNPFPAVTAVKTHQTGTKNPFGPVVEAPPPVPKIPTLFDLMSNGSSNMTNGVNGNQQVNGTPQQQQGQLSTQAPQQIQGQQTGGGFNWAQSALNPGSADISSIASSFTKLGQTKTGAQPNPSSPTSSGFSPTASGFSTSTTSGFTSPNGSSSNPFPSLSSQPTGGAGSALKPQMTGFAGLKPFKPSSSFGAALMDSVPQASGTSITPQTGNTATPSGFTTPSFSSSSTTSTNSSAFAAPSPTGSTAPSFTATTQSSLGVTGTLNSQPTGSGMSFGGMRSFTPTSAFGSTLGVGLRPQVTGGGSANPFRASMATTGSPAFGASSAGGAAAAMQPPPVPGLPASFTGMPFGQFGQSQGGQSTSSPFGQQQQQQQQLGQQQFGQFGSNAFNPGQQQQQNAPASLI